MQIKLELIAGLPKKELVEKIHFHQRQGERCLPPSVPPGGSFERALGFYLHDMDKRKMFRPFGDAAEWARKHLPQQDRPDKLILLARRLEKLCLLPVYVSFLLPTPSTSRRALELHLLLCLILRPVWWLRGGGRRCLRVPGGGLAGSADAGSRWIPG